MAPPLPLARYYDWLAVVGLATSLVLTIIYIDVVPDQIPTHFNAAGEPDNWSGKNMLWFLPVMGLFMYVFLGFMARISPDPNSNWSTMQPKPRETEAVKSLSLTMTGALRAIILLMFAYLSWGTIQIALDHSNQLWGGALPVFLVLIFGYVLYYTYQILIRSK